MIVNVMLVFPSATLVFVYVVLVFISAMSVLFNATLLCSYIVFNVFCAMLMCVLEPCLYFIMSC